MSSTAMTTIIKMIETLPEAAQNQVAEHLQGYLAEMQDEAKWDSTFKKTQKQLVAAARRAKKDVAKGRAN